MQLLNTLKRSTRSYRVETLERTGSDTTAIADKDLRIGIGCTLIQPPS